MKLLDSDHWVLPAVALSLLALQAAGAGPAMAQAYTYDEPVCGASYRDEPNKPKDLRVVWEMNAAQKCIQQSNVPTACRHYQSALAAAGHMSPEAGDASDLKTNLKTMIKIYGCQ